MNSGKYVFAQIVSFLRKNEFDKCAERYNGNKHYRTLTAWNHFLQLLFGQLGGCNGLRSICLCLKAHEDKLYHAGIRGRVNESSLSRAGERRDWRIFADFGAHLISLVRPMYTSSPLPDITHEGDIMALDSTTISLSLKLFSWAPGKYSRGAVKMHTLLDVRGNIPVFVHITDGKWHDSNALDLLMPQKNEIYVMDKAYFDLEALYRLDRAGAFFVTRPRDNLRFKAVTSNKVDPSTGLRCDQRIRLSGNVSHTRYPERLRRVKYFDAESGQTLVFLTNNFVSDPLEIAAIYCRRWQIEVFFKWMKQNLQIKTLWGHSENAVNIHIWVAVCAYLLIACIKAQLKSPYSIYEIMQITGISLFTKTPVNQLIGRKTSNQNVKELPNLFSDNTLLTHQ
jgi:hypothetical protein